MKNYVQISKEIAAERKQRDLKEQAKIDYQKELIRNNLTRASFLLKKGLKQWNGILDFSFRDDGEIYYKDCNIATLLKDNEPIIIFSLYHAFSFDYLLFGGQSSCIEVSLTYYEASLAFLKKEEIHYPYIIEELVDCVLKNVARYLSKYFD